jgi:hypothetical protein
LDHLTAPLPYYTQPNEEDHGYSLSQPHKVMLSQSPCNLEENSDGLKVVYSFVLPASVDLENVVTETSETHCLSFSMSLRQEAAATVP